MNAPAKITLSRHDSRTGYTMSISLAPVPGTIASTAAARKTPLELHQEARIPSAPIARPLTIAQQRPTIAPDRLVAALTSPMSVSDLAEVIGESVYRTGKALWDAQRAGYVISRKTRGPTVWARTGAIIDAKAYAPTRTMASISADMAERDARLIALIRSGATTVVLMTGATGWQENAIRKDLGRMEADGRVKSTRSGGGAKHFEVVQ